MVILRRFAAFSFIINIEALFCFASRLWSLLLFWFLLLLCQPFAVVYCKRWHCERCFVYLQSCFGNVFCRVHDFSIVYGFICLISCRCFESFGASLFGRFDSHSSRFWRSSKSSFFWRSFLLCTFDLLCSCLLFWNLWSCFKLFVDYLKLSTIF